MSSESQPNWREHGVKIIATSQLDLNTPQTPGMTRAAAITHARTGAGKLWAGTVIVNAGTYTLATSLDLNKSITLTGPNAAISPNGGTSVLSSLKRTGTGFPLTATTW